MGSVFAESRFAGLESRSLDCITAGRANLDLYPPENVELYSTGTFDAFVGGSPANIAAGLVRRGLKAGIITKVADDGIGHFVKNYLEQFGVDVSGVYTEKSEARTSLAFAERRRKADTVFYRQNPSDLLLEMSDISESYIADSRVLFLSGSALCQNPCRDAMWKAIAYAKKHGTVLAMDIDYRPYGWDVQERGDLLSEACSQCDLVIGTSEEFRIATGLEETFSSMEEEDDYFADLFPHAGLLVIKRGKKGANAREKDGRTVHGSLFPAAMKKPWGAGDAFASSLLASLLLGKSLEQSMNDGAMAASINISGLSCTGAMPDNDELQLYATRYKEGNLGSKWTD